jgi:hypothetical protein
MDDASIGSHLGSLWQRMCQVETLVTAGIRSARRVAFAGLRSKQLCWPLIKAGTVGLSHSASCKLSPRQVDSWASHPRVLKRSPKASRLALKAPPVAAAPKPAGLEASSKRAGTPQNNSRHSFFAGMR